MYTIYADNELIYDPRSPDYTILSGDLTLVLNTSGTLTFSLPPSNPSYGRVKLMTSVVSLYDDERLIFRGRPYAPSVDLFRQDTIECEGELAYLNDSVQLPFSLSTGDVKSFFQKIIDTHNQSMPKHKQFQVGEVTVINTTVEGNITRSSEDYTTTWTFISDKLLKPLGGYLQVRYQGDKCYIDYLADLNYIGTQEVTQAINVMSAKKEVTASDLATIIIPLGAKIKKENSEEEEYLTLKKLTGDIAVKSEDGIKQYGEIIKVVHHDQITQSENLLKAGRKDLAEALGVTTSITITAADLSKAGYKVTPFSLGTKIPVKVPNLNIDEKLLITSLKLDLLHPESNTLTVGSEQKGLSAYQVETRASIESVNRNLTRDIQTAKQDTIVRVVKETNSNITQAADNVKSEVATRYYNKEKSDELLESIRSMITQTAGVIEFNFEQYKKEQANINGDTADKFAELKKFIRFDGGDIVLGQEKNPLTLRIEHDRIRFLEDGVSSAYWQNSKFYASDGEFLNQLKLGKFAFIPRSTGNLTFTKVVD